MKVAIDRNTLKEIKDLTKYEYIYIFDKEPLVRFIKYYDNPALRYDGDNLSECWRTYSVSEEKFNNFMAKVKAL